ncbi:hypothetical protein [Sulfitobacter sp. SK012]|uniref:hypothetical protein n=1 Tax=Sulfitobacter sp. SK012 TaxID=1389005 RepID=UPI0013B4004A|nr:hypothetical protein [Sulfitobacter sp. SK012]
MTKFNAIKPTQIQIQVALNAILSSATFADANRLKSFLKFIVEEALNERGANLRAKIIASDVYGRRPEEGVEQETIVRVDAGRLRRRMDIYYSEEGAKDPVRIHVLAGGYVPTFELVELAEPVDDVSNAQTGKAKSFGRASVLSAVLASGIAGIGVGWISNDSADGESLSAMSIANSNALVEAGALRRSVNQVSSASLLALTFVEEAQELVFPSIDPVRVRASEMMCQRAIDFSPEQSTGYSCIAFAQSYLAFVAPNGAARTKKLSSARNAAATALRIDPTDAHAQMADAWNKFVDGDRVGALQRAKSTIKIAPYDEFLWNFYGMMMAFDGQGPELLASYFPNASNASGGERYHPFVLAGAYFQMGEFTKTLAAIDNAIEIEGRISALMTGIQIAAYEAIGDHPSAELCAANLIASWPRANYKPVLVRFFTDEADALAISTRIDSALARLEDS